MCLGLGRGRAALRLGPICQYMTGRRGCLQMRPLIRPPPHGITITPVVFWRDALGKISLLIIFWYYYYILETVVEMK